MYPSIFRQIRLATFAFLAMIVVALVVSAGLSWREQRQLQRAQVLLARLHAFEQLPMVAERRLSLIAESPADRTARETFERDVAQLILLAGDPETPERLRSVLARLPHTSGTRVEFAETLLLFNETDDREQARQAALIAELHERTATQVKLEAAAPLAILAVGLLLFPVARRRIIKPLEAFGRQLSRLAEGEFTPMPVDSRVDPFLLPLHRQFNALAARLQQLETAHRARAESLEEAVRAATAQLLEQQRNLARAERLAATGELAASIAHELRNPLAGLQMTLANLRTELTDPELRERVDLMIAEVGRLTRLLNGLLDSARHAPEAPHEVRLAEVVDEILELNRYYLAPELRLENHVDPELVCQLPPDRLRQALLNLILNAGTAMRGRAGVIRIEAAVEGSTLRITVTDDGPGFPPELLQGGIRPFFSTRTEGTGLGLALVRRFARDLGGTVELANCEPQGARVTVTVPLEH